jgi:hypothetical protein
VGLDLFSAYILVQAVLIGGFFFVPYGAVLHPIAQMAVGLLSVAFVVRGARRSAHARATWYLFGAGVLFNTIGIGVADLLERFGGIFDPPNASDIFFLGLYPCLVAGLARMVHRQSVGREVKALVLSTFLSTLVIIGLGIFTWEFIIWPQGEAHPAKFIGRLVMTAYPLADLVLLALMLRLLFAGSAMNPALAMMFLSLAGFLGADIVWAVIARTGVRPGPSSMQLLRMTTLMAYALMGSAIGHPTLADVGRPADESDDRPHGATWVTIAIPMLSAPGVLLIEALLDWLYDL